MSWLLLEIICAQCVLVLKLMETHDTDHSVIDVTDVSLTGKRRIWFYGVLCAPFRAVLGFILSEIVKGKF